MFLAAAAVQVIAAPEVRVLLKEEMVLRVVPPRNERLQVLDAAGRSLGVFAQGFTLRAAADGIEGLAHPTPAFGCGRISAAAASGCCNAGIAVP